MMRAHSEQRRRPGSTLHGGWHSNISAGHNPHLAVNGDTVVTWLATADDGHSSDLAVQGHRGRYSFVIPNLHGHALARVDNHSFLLSDYRQPHIMLWQRTDYNLGRGRGRSARHRWRGHRLWRIGRLERRQGGHEPCRRDLRCLRWHFLRLRTACFQGQPEEQEEQHNNGKGDSGDVVTLAAMRTRAVGRVVIRAAARAFRKPATHLV